MATRVIIDLAGPVTPGQLLAMFREHAPWVLAEEGVLPLFPDGALLTIGQAGRLLGVGATTVAAWVRAGKITPVAALGVPRRFRESDVRALLLSKRKGTALSLLPGDAEPMLTTGEVAALFGVCASTVRRWEKIGRITSVRVADGNRGFREEEVRALANARKNGSAGGA